MLYLQRDCVISAVDEKSFLKDNEEYYYAHTFVPSTSSSTLQSHIIWAVSSIDDG
jgi:hypothetical protein